MKIVVRITLMNEATYRLTFADPWRIYKGFVCISWSSGSKTYIPVRLIKRIEENERGIGVEE